MKSLTFFFLASLLRLSADTIELGGDDWTVDNHGRTFIGGGGDEGWTIYDDGTNGNSSRQQWIWMDVSTALASVPAGHFIESANLRFSNAEDLDSDGDTVVYSIFGVPDENRGRDSIIAGGATPNHDGDDVLDYVVANTGYGSATGVISATSLDFDISTLVARWHSGSITTNVGQMMLLWDTRGGNRNYVRFVPSGADNSNGDFLERPILTIVTTTTPPPNSNPPTEITISRDTINLSGATTSSLMGALSNNDPDGNDSHTYALVAGDGDDHNASFAISNNDLNLAANLDAGDYSVRVSVTDEDLNTHEEILTFIIVDNQAPTAPTLAGGLINLNGFFPATVDVVSADDPNLAFSPIDVLSFNLVTGEGDTDNSLFFLDSTTGALTFNGPATAGATYVIRVSASDSTNLSTESILTLQVAELLGNEIGPRGSATDGSDQVFHPNNVEMPEGSNAEGVAIYIQDAAAQEGAIFKIYLLRPTAADEYNVVYDSGDITVTGGTTGGTSIYSFPNGPVLTQAGDIFAHYGRGIPYSGGGDVPIYWPVAVPPIQDETVILGPTGTLPERVDLARDYAWAIVINGSSPPLGLDLTITQSGGETSLKWNAKVGKTYRVETSTDLENWEPSTDVASVETPTIHSFTTPADLTRFYRVVELP